MSKLSFLKNKLFLRILLYFLSLLLPIIIIGAIFYINYTERIKAEFLEKIQLNLYSNAKLINSYIHASQETNISFLLNSDVQAILKPFDQYTLQDKIRLPQITQAFSRIKSITSEVVDQSFVYMDNQKIYTSGGVDDYSTFFRSFYRFEKYDPGFWERMLHIKQGELVNILEPSVVHTVNSTQKNVIPIIIKDKIKGNNVIMVTTIPVRLIEDTLKNNSLLSSTHFIVVDDQNRVVLSDIKINTDTLNQLKKKRSLIEGKDSLINYVKSNDFGWSYYAVTPISEIRSQADGMINMLLAICIVLIIISIFIAFIFTFNLYSPIKKIRDMLVTKENLLQYDLNMNKNELEIIGNGIQQMMESNNKLNVLSMEYLDSTLDQLVKGNQLQNQSAVEKILAGKLGFHMEYYVCCNIKFDFSENFFELIEEVDRIIILHKLKKVIWGLLNHYLKSFVLEYDQHLFVCIMNVESEERETLHKALTHLTEVFKYDLHYCSITIGIGRQYPGVKGISMSYRDGMTAIESRQGDTGFQIIDSKDLSIEHNVHYSFADENRIINYTKSGDWVLLEKELQAIIQRNKDNGVSYHFMNLLLLEIYNTGTKIATERGMNLSRLLTEEEKDKLSANKEYPMQFYEKQQLLLTFFQKMAQYFVDHNNNGSGNIISDIIAYIENNYQSDLYLDKISSELGFSSKYISRHFKEKMNINLSDYISQIRIQYAKSMLRDQPTLQIKTISEQVGIYSRMTFLRLFKKYEGISPNEYRELIKKKENDTD